MRISSNKNSSLHYQGCLIGGAIGDALGWPVEFISLNEIRNVYGQHGVKSIDIVNGLPAEISDDTQMTLFTAEGTLRAMTRSRHKGICHLPSVIYTVFARIFALAVYTRCFIRSERTNTHRKSYQGSKIISSKSTRGLLSFRINQRFGRNNGKTYQQ